MSNKNYKLNDVQEVSSISDLMQKAVEQAGEKVAFRYKNDEDIIDVTYNKFQKNTFYLGTALKAMDINQKHIAVIGENSYEWLTVYLTVLKSENVLVPIDRELSIDEIIYILNHSDSEVLFYSKKIEDKIEQIEQQVAKIKYFIEFDRKADDKNKFSYKKFLELGKDIYNKGNTSYENIKNDINNLKLIVYTSGTTGTAKGVMLSEKNLISVVYYGMQVASVYDTCLSVLPYHHTYEAVSGILVALHNHTTICINDNIKNVVSNIQTFKPDYIYLVPAFAEVFYKKIWATAKKDGKDGALKKLIKTSNALRKVGIDLRNKFFKSIKNSLGGNLKQIVVGGAPLRNEIGEFFDSIGIDLLNGYGITECSPLVSVNRPKFNNPETVGVVLPCCQIKFENITEEGIGEICVKGDIVMMGYYKDEEKTNQALVDGWFKTGDFGKMNDKEQLIVTGRKKNIIVLQNGKNVYPEEIENIILGIDYVQDIIVKEKENSKTLCAEIYLNKELAQNIENKQETLKKDISELLKNFPTYKHITDIEIRDEEFEKTTTAKIKR